MNSQGKMLEIRSQYIVKTRNRLDKDLDSIDLLVALPTPAFGETLIGLEVLISSNRMTITSAARYCVE